MMDNSSVQTFNYVGNKNGTGSINFKNTEGRIIAAIEMTRHQDGLWYTTNPVLMPPAEDTPTIPTTTAECLEHPTITKTAILSPIDETRALHDNTISNDGTPNPPIAHYQPSK
jgi:hypothetical protein